MTQYLTDQEEVDASLEKGIVPGDHLQLLPECDQVRSENIRVDAVMQHFSFNTILDSALLIIWIL